MIVQFTVLIALTVTLVSTAAAKDLEGEYLYKVTTMRAEPGSLAGLLDWIAALKDSGYFDDSGDARPYVARHSQGDHWDLMLIKPMQSWGAYFSQSAIFKREKTAAAHARLLSQGAGLIAFEEDHFAYGPPVSAIDAAYAENGFFHIEMFAAVAGKAGNLVEQRRMENAYLSATGQTPNMIFRRAGGSDIDVFTIGFHKSLAAFAAPASVTDDEKESAAKAAGFKGLGDISFYLRSLISSHHDTLAVKVK